MNEQTNRRVFLGGAALGATAIGLGLTRRAAAQAAQEENGPIDMEVVRECVILAHQRNRFDELKALLDAHPAAVNATMDWRMGDWESALGGAAHIGNKDIARLLLERGARMDVYAAAMLGHLDAVKAMVKADPEAPTKLGPHGIPLISHARRGGAEDVQAFLVFAGGDDGPGGFPVRHLDRYTGRYTLEDGREVELTADGEAIAFEESKSAGALTLAHAGGHAFEGGRGGEGRRVSFRMNCAMAWGIRVQRGEERVQGVREG